MVKNIRMDRNEEPISIDALNRCLIGDTIMNRNEKSNVNKKDHVDSIIATIDRFYFLLYLIKFSNIFYN